MIKMLQQAITNTLETKENLENLNNEIECLQRKRMYTEEPDGNDRMYCDHNVFIILNGPLGELGHTFNVQNFSSLSQLFSWPSYVFSSQWLK